MSDQSCLAVICGGCCIAVFSALESWCNLKAYGSDGCCGGCCGGQRGCCHSCFDGGFNKDAWEEDEAKRAGKSRDGNKEGDVVDQPTAVADMEKPVDNSVPAPAEGEHVT